MIKFQYAAIVMLVIAGVSAHTQEQRPKGPSSCCSIVEEALHDVSKIKPGMKRADLAAMFTTEGGLDFHIETIYVWKTCPYIKIKVSFALENSTALKDSPSDVITAVSEPYIQYPVRD